MNDREIVVKAWKNGEHNTTGAGYGLKVLSVLDRDNSFKREWGTIALWLPDVDQPIQVNIDKNSFWDSTCWELIHIDIGRWLLRSRLAPWPPRNLPSFILRPIGEGVFEVTAMVRTFA